MKQAILPIILAIVFVALVLVLNKNIELPGVILAGAIGLGVGAILNNIIFKGKKSAEKEEETK